MLSVFKLGNIVISTKNLKWKRQRKLKISNNNNINIIININILYLPEFSTGGIIIIITLLLLPRNAL